MPDNHSSDRADVVIVGGGSAGSVLAARLSEDPSRSVLLLEAGTAYGVDGYPDDLRDPARVPANPEHEWGFTARGGGASPEIDVPRAKVLGGCSAHNATVAMRARPSDIRDWQRHGIHEWTLDAVDATYREMENTPDGDDIRRGRTGPFPIRQQRYDDLTSSLRGFIDATAAAGFSRVDDFNGPNPSGVGAYPVNVVDGVRQNTGLVYLTEEVRTRPNLKIVGNEVVDRVVFDGRRATGGAIALSVAVVKPDSRGTVRLRSRDPQEQPEIDCNFLAEGRDLRRMLEGVRLARTLGRDPALARFLELEIIPGDAVGDDQLADAVTSNLASYGHPAATAPMGGPQNPWAVVNSRGAVNGIDGLRVVDASIMPVVPSVAINPTTIMIAERIAQAVYGREPEPSHRC